MSRPLLALYIGWSVWAALWLAASWWQKRGVRRASGLHDMAHKLITIAGLVALLVVTRPRGGLSIPLWHLGSVTEWAMVAVMVAGFAFACWARVALGTLWSVGVERKADHRLVDDGPYAIVRHPIYTGLIGAGIAMAAVKATPLAVAGFALITIGLAVKARLEERFLADELGHLCYDDYRRRVPMLVPFLSPGASVAK